MGDILYRWGEIRRASTAWGQFHPIGAVVKVRNPATVNFTKFCVQFVCYNPLIILNSVRFAEGILELSGFKQRGLFSREKNCKVPNQD